MNMKAYKHKLRNSIPLVSVDTIIDKAGDIWFSVEYRDEDGSMNHHRYKHLSSAIDFIESNF